MRCSFHHYGPLNSRGAVRIYALLRQHTATASCCRACPLVVVGLSSSCRRVVVELPSSLPSDTHDLLRLDTLQQAPSQYTLEARAQPPWLLRTGRRQQGRGDSRCYGSSRSGSLQHGRQVLRGALYEEQHATGHRGDVRPKQGNWVQKSPQPVDSTKHERQFSVASIWARRGGHREQGLSVRRLRWGAGGVCDDGVYVCWRLHVVVYCHAAYVTRPSNILLYECVSVRGRLSSVRRN